MWYANVMNLIITVLVVLVLLNLLGYHSFPGYVSGGYYWNAPVIILILLVLFFSRGL